MPQLFADIPFLHYPGLHPARPYRSALESFWKIASIVLRKYADQRFAKKKQKCGLKVQVATNPG